MVWVDEKMDSIMSTLPPSCYEGLICEVALHLTLDSYKKIQNEFTLFVKLAESHIHSDRHQ
jgi:predicted benzoate:H+ symporter BenE